MTVLPQLKQDVVSAADRHLSRTSTTRAGAAEHDQASDRRVRRLWRPITVAASSALVVAGVIAVIVLETHGSGQSNRPSGVGRPAAAARVAPPGPLGPTVSRQARTTQTVIVGYQQVVAKVIMRGQKPRSSEVQVDAGSSSGVRVGDPVTGPNALVGKVSRVADSTSEVSLITDHAAHIPAEVKDSAGDDGVLKVKAGDPNTLLLEGLPRHANVSPGELVVTPSFRGTSKRSQSSLLYPPGIQIGKIASFSRHELLDNGQVPVTPLASIHHFTSVKILIKPYVFGGSTHRR
jgi:hypothetical protein